MGNILSLLFSPKGKVDRLRYFLAGLILFFIKYNFDRVIAEVFFDVQWFIEYYIRQPDYVNAQGELPEKFQHFYLFLLATAIPFIYMGVVLTIKRLRDIGMTAWASLLFFVPFINLLFFAILSVLPSKLSEQETVESRQEFIGRLIPESKFGAALLSVGIVSVLSTLLMVLSVQYLEDYGWGVFVGIPFFIGFAGALLYGYHEERTLGECVSVGSIGVLFMFALLLVIALEGVICLLMAAPMAFPIAWLGAIVGYYVQKDSPDVQVTPVIVALLVTIPALMGLEDQDDRLAPLIPATTEIVIDAPPEVVWENVVTFAHIEEEPDWFFKTGLAYPTHATIEGTGVGAVRHCMFTTGPFVEPITVWDEPHLLKFSVAQHPPAMEEWNPFYSIHTPHIHGYFESQEGQFLLTDLGDGKTHLAGTTWYRHNVWPNMYWKPWSDLILHRIHDRVLRHIKRQSEGDSI